MNKLISYFKNIIEQKKKADSDLNDNFKIGESRIHGKGVFAKKDLQTGEFINTALYQGDSDKRFHTTRFGAHLNHSYNPNAITNKDGDKYLTYAGKKINNGEEITVDYTKNLELEQPDPSWR